jgi:hypothetical protein
VFKPGPHGVVGLVDDLLELCREQPLQLEWQAGQCHVHLIGTEKHESISLPFQKSVFRAVVARISALCNEAVSPYGGVAALPAGIPPVFFHVAFTNTPGEQRLEVRCLGDGQNVTSEQSRHLTATAGKSDPRPQNAVTPGKQGVTL